MPIKLTPTHTLTDTLNITKYKDNYELEYEDDSGYYSAFSLSNENAAALFRFLARHVLSEDMAFLISTIYKIEELEAEIIVEREKEQKRLEEE